MSSVQALVEAAKRQIREIDPAELQQLQQTGVPIIDVREPAEYAAGHFPGAVNIPRGVLEFEVDGHPAVNCQRDPALGHRGQPVVVACRSGGRSALAAAALTSFAGSHGASRAVMFALDARCFRVMVAHTVTKYGARESTIWYWLYAPLLEGLL